MPVPPLSTGRMPLTPDVSGRPVALVRVTLIGVPRAGATSVGLTPKTLRPDPVLEVLEKSVSAQAAKFALTCADAMIVPDEKIYGSAIAVPLRFYDQ